MKKKILIILSLLFSLIGCISSIDHLRGGVKVENRLKVYIDNLSSQNITVTIEINNIKPITFGGITIEKNTTGSFIEVDFTKDKTAEDGELYGMGLYLTSGSAIIKESGISSYNKYSDGIYMLYPRPRMVIKDSQSTESAFEVTRESY